MGAQVLVLNCGSSSIKYRLLDMEPGKPGESGGPGARLATGLVERIGERESVLTHRGAAPDPYVQAEACADHDAGLRAVLRAFDAAGPALDGVIAIGHRVVHGGARFSDPVRVDAAVEQAIEELSPLAPLHNPANLEGIRVARQVFPDRPHVAVFDTAFHQTLPAAAYTYAVPRAWAADLEVRRYGFHGTSYSHVSRRAAALLGRPLAETNAIVLHLGNGASAAAVRGGRSVDTSMGLTPLEGLVMGTRCGDVDPALPAYLHRVAGLSIDEIDAALNERSGMLGLCGANDMREVWRLVDAGDADARSAVRVYCHRIRHYVGAYYAVLGRVDAVVFTAGVGENDARIRAGALSGLERLGIAVDPARNEPPTTRGGTPGEPGGGGTPGEPGERIERGMPGEESERVERGKPGEQAERGKPGERVVSPDGAEVAVLVIPTDEELEIATQTLACARAQRDH